MPFVREHMHASQREKCTDLSTPAGSAESNLEPDSVGKSEQEQQEQQEAEFDFDPRKKSAFALDPRDKKRICEADKRREDMYIDGYCQLAECGITALEFLLLRFKVVRSKNQLKVIAQKMRSPEILGELSANYCEMNEPFHWTSSPLWILMLNLVKCTAEEACENERQKSQEAEDRERQLNDRLWEDTFREALEDDDEAGEYRRTRGTSFGGNRASSAGGVNQNNFMQTMKMFDRGLRGFAETVDIN
jgi:hypothetical protein